MKKNRYKPFYKQFLLIRKNIQNRIKVFKFKRLKWKKFQDYARKQLRFYKRYKFHEQYRIKVSKFASKGNSFKKKFRNDLRVRKSFSLFYGGLKKKYIKTSINKIKKIKNSNNFSLNTLKFFESRLDTILYRSKFSFSIKNARQMIRHGHVLVNGLIIKTKSYLLKSNDLVEIAYNLKSRSFVKKNLDRSNFWPIPPKHLIVNYKTCQIIYIDSNTFFNLPNFEHYLNIDSLVINISNS